MTKNFFMKAAGAWDGWRMVIDRLLDSGDAVIVEGRYQGLYRPTGRKMDLQVCHVWRLSDGKIMSFHQYLDTARLQDVMGKAGHF